MVGCLIGAATIKVRLLLYLGSTPLTPLINKPLFMNPGLTLYTTLRNHFDEKQVIDHQMWVYSTVF